MTALHIESPVFFSVSRALLLRRKGHHTFNLRPLCLRIEVTYCRGPSGDRPFSLVLHVPQA